MRNLLRAAILFLAAAGLPACAPDSVGRYQTGETTQEATALLNGRQYQKVIWLIENRHAGDPGGEDAYLLAQAYLGKAGVEPLAFAAAISAPEPDTEAARALFPQCPKGELRSHRGVPMKCILKRVYLRAPKADDPDFARARYLLRRAYPDPSAAPEWVNTLIGLVETISVVSRAGDVYLFGKGQSPAALMIGAQVRLPWLKNHGRRAREEARYAIARARHSGPKIAGLLSGSKADVWFEQVDGTVVYAETVGLPKFLDFVRDHVLKPGDEIRYGEILDRLRDLVAQEENSLLQTDGDE
jgi:hypothetical protein